MGERKNVAITLAAVMTVAGSAFVGGNAVLQSRADGEAPPPVVRAVDLPPAPTPAPAPVVAPVVEEKAQEQQPEPEVTITAEERARLAAEMGRWVTRHPHELVEVIANLAEQKPLPVPATFLLSIAWSETRGKVLAVSPAGAAGLAQATPAAYLSEGLDGKLFVTNGYLMGTRAYIMKKPLGDALAISEPLVKRNTPAARARASKLVARAIELRQEGMEELEALRPVANDTFYVKIAEADAHNLATLRELESLIERGAPRPALQRYRARVQKDYTHLRNLQRGGWAKYEQALTGQRDRMLEQRFGQKAATVIQTRPYEAGEYLGEALDARFSPTQMADFLAAHLASKQQQARDLGIAEEKLDAWTAALYNGGAVNIKRMRAGLIASLAETQKYMKAVPARMARLDQALGS
ncbi:MAG TPA: hypothetical protein VF432_33300 [Thermoanaerobaculia bacterium]